MDSILCQNFNNFEFIIIDDGSTDRSWEIIQSFSDSRIVPVRNTHNQGLARSLNAGIQLSKGCFIARMDCDDLAMPHRLAEQVTFLTANPNIAVCGTWVELFGARKGIWNNPIDHDRITCKHLFGNCLAHPSVAMRKDVLIDNNLFYDENLARSQDYELWVRISRTHRLANLGKILLKHRLHSRNLSSEYQRDQREIADQIRRDQLLKLGVDFNTVELRLHSKISRWVYEPTRHYLLAAENWFQKIKTANQNNAMLNQNALADEISSRWWDLCKHATVIGLSAYTAFHSSSLSDPISVDFKQKVVFFLKCAAKYGKNSL